MTFDLKDVPGGGPDQNYNFMTALACYGVASAVVSFDGSGDSGQIQDIYATGLSTELDSVPLRPEHAAMVANPSGAACSLYELIETFAYTLMEATGQDWYNNDGGFGEVHIHPGLGKAWVDMNIRETTSIYSKFDYSLPGAEEDQPAE